MDKRGRGAVGLRNDVFSRGSLSQRRREQTLIKSENRGDVVYGWSLRSLRRSRKSRMSGIFGMFRMSGVSGRSRRFRGLGDSCP